MGDPGMTLSAHKFPAVYTDLGIDLSALGCVMLDLEPIPVSTVIPDDWTYTSPDPAKFWIKGAVGDHPHATLLYGLLESAHAWRQHVDDLLAGVRLDAVTIDHVGVFPSPYSDEPYSCIVGHLDAEPGSALREAHDRLTFLPHVATFPGYKAHVTLAYVKPEYEASAVGALDEAFAGRRMAAAGINYGTPPT